MPKRFAIGDFIKELGPEDSEVLSQSLHALRLRIICDPDFLSCSDNQLKAVSTRFLQRFGSKYPEQRDDIRDRLIGILKLQRRKQKKDVRKKRVKNGQGTAPPRRRPKKARRDRQQEAGIPMTNTVISCRENFFRQGISSMAMQETPHTQPPASSTAPMSSATRTDRPAMTSSAVQTDEMSLNGFYAYEAFNDENYRINHEKVPVLLKAIVKIIDYHQSRLKWKMLDKQSSSQEKLEARIGLQTLKTITQGFRYDSLNAGARLVSPRLVTGRIVRP